MRQSAPVSKMLLGSGTAANSTATVFVPSLKVGVISVPQELTAWDPVAIECVLLFGE